MSPVDPRGHALECPECHGACEVSSNGHDPNADIYECDRCLGVGEVSCDGCDVCQEPEPSLSLLVDIGGYRGGLA